MFDNFSIQIYGLSEDDKREWVKIVDSGIIIFITFINKLVNMQAVEIVKAANEPMPSQDKTPIVAIPYIMSVSYLRHTGNLSNYDPGLGNNAILSRTSPNNAQIANVDSILNYTLQIESTIIIDKSLDKHTEYIVKVTTMNSSWTCSRRYKEFSVLHTTLEPLLKNLSISLSLPPKRWWVDKLDPKFIEERRKGLSNYVKILAEHVRLFELIIII